MHEIKKSYIFLNPYVLFFFILLLLIACEFQYAEGNVLSIHGREGFPYFDQKGNLNIVYINSNGGISTLKTSKDDLDKFTKQEYLHGDNVNSLSLNEDKSGKIWLAWEKSKYQRMEKTI